MRSHKLLRSLQASRVLPLILSGKRTLRGLKARGLRRLNRFRRREVLRADDACVRISYLGVWPVLAEQVETFDPRIERRRNLDAVLTVCERAGAGYFENVTDQVGRSRVGLTGDLVPLLRQLQRCSAASLNVALERRGRVIEAVPARCADELRRSYRSSDLLLVFHGHVIGEDGVAVDGRAIACEIDLWTVERSSQGVVLSTEAPNAVCQAIRLPEVHPGRIEIRELGWHPDGWRPPFDIDAVYTWVNSDDPEWQARRDAHESNETAADGRGVERYESFDELRYSLRSLWQHAPFFRNIFLVTDQQLPEWLIDDAGVTVVDHTDIFHAADALPVFNSHAIESQLHHIPGLAHHYVYVNDDVFFGSNIGWRTFFTVGGLARFAESKAQIPIRPSIDDPAVDHSGANARALLQELVGYAPSQKIKHIPHPQLRSVHEELEGRIPDVYASVAASRFRSTNDVSLAALVHHRFGEATGRAIPCLLDYEYINLARPDLARLLARLTETPQTTFCLNDASLPLERRAHVRSMLEHHLPAMFPLRAPWEREGH